jgi:hypothetical protein
MILVLTYAGGHSDTWPLEPLMCGAQVRVPVGTLGKSSTDFDLTTHVYPQRYNPASPLQLYFLSLPAYSIHASIMYYVYSCIMYNKNTINQKEWHVATKRL